MRQVIRWPVVLVGLTMVAGLAIADVPDWDWQATFAFNAQGEVTSRTLDFSSNYWLDDGLCSGWSLVLETNESTSNSTHMEIARLDTTNKLMGWVIQDNGNINQKRWLCAGAVRIDVPDAEAPPGVSSCQVGVTGGDCTGPMDCSESTEVGVVATTAISTGQIHNHCRVPSVSCSPLSGIVTCNAEGDPTEDSGACHADPGIWVATYCTWD